MTSIGPCSVSDDNDDDDDDDGDNVDDDDDDGSNDEDDENDDIATCPRVCSWPRFSLAESRRLFLSDTLAMMLAHGDDDDGDVDDGDDDDNVSDSK